LLAAAVIGDETCVGGIGLAAAQVAVAMCLDGPWVDDAEDRDFPIEVVGEAFPVAAGGFHAGVDGEIRTGVLGEPVKELGVTLRVVGELTAGDALAAFPVEEGDVVIGLGDVDPEAEFVV